ncbi:dihydroxy-acid dehydratase, partial [Salmonella enterica subsp. enterica serovar Give]|nr:dihydroxy-acid dehydratase [Salmonella enterica subsp. enterica serovar Give]
RPAATRVMLLGAGELGKEVAIECQRLGIEVIAVDRYPDAPAMVFESQHDVLPAFDAGLLDRDCVVVVRHQGPKANGMPEL